MIQSYLYGVGETVAAHYFLQNQFFLSIFGHDNDDNNKKRNLKFKKRARRAGQEADEGKTIAAKEREFYVYYMATLILCMCHEL